jgi:hypothetical protein
MNTINKLIFTKNTKLSCDNVQMITKLIVIEIDKSVLLIYLF